MRLLTQILIGLVFLTECWGQQTFDQDAVKKSVETFYKWYIGTTKDLRYSQYVRGVKSESGMTKLETTEYFKRLDSLEVIGREFVKSENERFKSCSDFLNSFSWTEFSTADNFPAEDKCGFLYSYYWTFGHEPHDGVHVTKVTINKNIAYAETNIYFGDNKLSGDKVIVSLAKKNDKWMITKILKN